MMMMMLSRVNIGLLLLLTILCANAQKQQFKVDPSTQYFVDELGRVRLFHGVNAVYKVPPYIPETNSFTPQTSLSAKDIALMSDWGFNVVRLGVMWPGVEPAPGHVNVTYLNEMRALVDRLGDAGIYTIVDFHQDVLSNRFCGEGVPDWSVGLDAEREPFAGPVGPVLHNVPGTVHPNVSECLERPFGLYYFSAQASAAFQRLYDNVDGFQDALVGYWGAVAAAFAESPNVLGYELINEPWCGDYLRDPSLLLPGVADKRNLAPMYRRLNGAIRQHDAERIVFFENSLLDLTAKTGFTPATTPGGVDAQDRQALSYHIYCGPDDKQGDPRYIGLCNVENDYFYANAMDDVQRIGAGAFLTEFGAVANATTGVEMIDHLLDLADRHIQSWAYWAYKLFGDFTTQGSGESMFASDGSAETNKLASLTRTYATAIAGVPTLHRYSTRTGHFALHYNASASIDAPTQVYFYEALHYPNGATFQARPSSVTVAHVATNTVLIYHHGQNVDVEFEIVRK
jgi:endoglycosylceramidase